MRLSGDVPAFSALCSVPALFPFPAICVLCAFRTAHQCGNFRKDFHTLHKHLSSCHFLLKPKPSPNPVTTPCFYSPQCMAGQALPCVCRTAQDARHFSAQECLELPLTLEHISQQGVIASLCTFAWILLDIILHVRKSLEYRAVAALSSSLS